MATITEATTTRPDRVTPDPPGDHCVALEAIGWGGYETILQLRGDRGRPRLIYLDGTLDLMSPSYRHEILNDRLSDLVKAVALALDLPFKAARSTTFRRERDEAGAEADSAFYFANAFQIVGKTELDLRRDPPPDLVIEAVHTHGADTAVEVWRRLGVPEVWVCDARRLQILALQANGRYSDQPTSVAVPFLSADEIHEQIRKDPDALDSDWHKGLRLWVAETVVERYRRLP